MKLVDRARVDIRLGEYGVAPATALADVALLSRVQEYRRLIGSRIMAIGKEDIRARVPAGPSHVSRKVDGEFTVLAVDGDEAFTLNPGGTVRMANGKGHQAIMETVYGQTQRKGGKLTMVNVRRYPAEKVNPPANMKAADWIKSGFKSN